MDLRSEYEMVKNQILSALHDSLAEIGEGLQKEMHEEADRTVYAYNASPEAMDSRRYTIADKENLMLKYGYLSVTVISTAEMQGDDYGVTEGDFVQLGLENYKQPYERDFMWNALERYVRNGKADDAIRAALERNGIDSTGYSGEDGEIIESLVATRTLEE